MAETEEDHRWQSCGPDIAKETEIGKKLIGVESAETMSMIIVAEGRFS